MAFTGNTKYGYTDGDQIGNHGSQFPIFARVRGSDVYAVAREDNPASSGRFGKMFTIGREFLRNTVFGASKSDADLFADKPHNIEDTSEPGSSFVLINNTDTIIKRPNTGSTTTPVTTTPTTTPTTTTTPATTTTPTTTTVPQTGLVTSTPTTTTKVESKTETTAMTPTVKWAIIAVAVAIVGGVLYMMLRGSNQPRYGRRGNGRRY